MSRLTKQAEQALRRPERDLLACAQEIDSHRRSRNEVVRRALGVADTCAMFVITICNEPEGSPSARDSPEYLTAIRQATTRMRVLQRTLDHRRQIGREYTEKVGRKLQAFGISMAKVGEAYREFVVSTSEGGSQPNVLDDVDKFEDELSIWLASAEEADDPRSGTTNDGSIDLAGQLARDIRTEERAAEWFRASAVLVLVLVAVVASRYLFSDTLDERLVGPELLRLSVTVPLGVLAGYFARASSQHRYMARQLSGLRLQLVTLDTFVAGFSVEDGQRYRYDVGERLYSTYASAPPEAAEQPGFGQEIVGALEGLAHGLRNSVGGRTGAKRSPVRSGRSGSAGLTRSRKPRTRRGRSGHTAAE